MSPEFDAAPNFKSHADFDDQAGLLRLPGREAPIAYHQIIDYSYVEERGRMGRGGVARAFSTVFSGDFVATAMKIRLLLAGNPPEEVFIPLLITPVKASTLIYRGLKAKADALMAKLEQTCPRQNSAPGDYIEEIRRLGQLREQGMLTQEEFEVKKKQLLGL